MHSPDDLDKRAEALFAQVQAGEELTLAYQGETSDFIRFNEGRVRQAGTVEQHAVSLALSRGARVARAALTLTGEAKQDAVLLSRWLERLRAAVPALPEDPYRLFPEHEPSGAAEAVASLPDPREVVVRVGETFGAGQRGGAAGAFVGIYAAGALRSGFASTRGQRNWHASSNFHLDWSLHDPEARAVKSMYAGTHWNAAAFEAHCAQAQLEYAALAHPGHATPRGAYRAYLTPAALLELVDMVCLSGFGLRAQRTKQTPLLHLVEGQETLSALVHVAEDAASGAAPPFQADGFARQPRVDLIEAGRHKGNLVSPRSAREFGETSTGAETNEIPQSLTMAPGTLPTHDILRRLGTGIYVGNLFYVNFSDRMACRTTGMTRFGTFWVEGGEIRAPIPAMRFDESIYRVLGERLVDLTDTAEYLPNGSTYLARSRRTRRLPGALVEDFTLTL